MKHKKQNEPMNNLVWDIDHLAEDRVHGAVQFNAINAMVNIMYNRTWPRVGTNVWDRVWRRLWGSVNG